MGYNLIKNGLIIIMMLTYYNCISPLPPEPKIQITKEQAVNIKNSFISTNNLEFSHYSEEPFITETHFIFYFNLFAFRSASELNGIWVDRITGECFIPVNVKDSKKFR